MSDRNDDPGEGTRRERPRDRRGRYLGGPIPLSEALGAVSDRLGVAKPDVLGVIFGHWEELVGTSLASHTRPLKLHDDTLVLAVDHGAWATQVRHMSAEILARIRDFCPAERAPQRLEVRVRQ